MNYTQPQKMKVNFFSKSIGLKSRFSTNYQNKEYKELLLFLTLQS
jgi:hypothetical protein